MNVSKWFGFSRFALVAMVLTGGAMAQDQGYPDQQGQGQQGQGQDPPDRIARVAFLQGDVSLQPASENGDAPFGAAEVNYTVSVGDRVFTGQTGMSELQSDNLAVRLGRLSDVTLQSFSQDYVQLGLAQGSLRLRSYALGQAGSLEVDTANGAFTVLQAGDIRVSSYPGFGQRPDTTIVTVNAGRVQASANGVNTVIELGQVLRIDSTGQDQAQAQFVQMLPMDELDQFDQQRDEQRAAAAEEIRDQYVNPSMVGYDDLASNGDWAPSPDYGQVWYPRGVAADWSPYHNGHWAYIAPWGETWVEAEPWGYAPFHYGRWAQFGPRWGWIPGPVVVRPIYSPALVAFVGGGGFSLSVRVGGGGGVAAWFPLGPREPFVPWYRSSPGYVNRVNVSNIYNRNTVEVRNVYVNRTTNVYVNRTTNVYVNRDRGTVAVPQDAFARGRQVRGAQVRVDARQMQGAQVMTRPPDVGQRPQGPPQGLAPARVVPPTQNRPVFQGRGGDGRGQPGQGRFGQGQGQQQPGQNRPGQGQNGQGRPNQPGQNMQPIPVAPATQGQQGGQGQVPPARVPGGMRPGNPGNANPDLPPNQQQPNGRDNGRDGGRNGRPTDPGANRPTAPNGVQPGAQPQPGAPGASNDGRSTGQTPGQTQRPGGQDGGRNGRPGDAGGTRPTAPVTPQPQPAPNDGRSQGQPSAGQVLQTPTPARVPGGMRPQGNPDQPQRPNGQDFNAPVGGGRNNRPADPGVMRPSVPAPAPTQPAAPADRGQRFDRQDQPRQNPPVQPQQPQRQAPPPQQQAPPQRQERPIPTPAPPQQQVRPQPQPQAPPVQVRPLQVQPQPRQAPPPRPPREEPK